MSPLLANTSQTAPRSPLDVAEGPATLSEVFAEGAADGAATGFVLAHLKPGSSVLWVQDRLSRREGGRPYVAGFGVALNLLYLEASKARDVLWAVEQGLGCGALSAVVGEVWGEPAALDFTATRRLALRAEAQGVRALLVRRAATPGLSAARDRWRVAALPSQGSAPRWQLTLLRALRHPQAEWVVRHDGPANRLSPERPALAAGAARARA